MAGAGCCVESCKVEQFAPATRSRARQRLPRKSLENLPKLLRRVGPATQRRRFCRMILVVFRVLSDCFLRLSIADHRHCFRNFAVRLGEFLKSWLIAFEQLLKRWPLTQSGIT